MDTDSGSLDPRHVVFGYRSCGLKSWSSLRPVSRYNTVQGDGTSLRRYISNAPESHAMAARIYLHLSSPDDGPWEVAFFLRSRLGTIRVSTVSTVGCKGTLWSNLIGWTDGREGLRGIWNPRLRVVDLAVRDSALYSREAPGV